MPKKSKVLVVVARRYNPKEFWPLLKVLKEAEIETEVVSPVYVIQDEDTGEAHKVSTRPQDLQGSHGKDYAGIAVISGNPKDTEYYYKNVQIQRLITEVNTLGRPLAAICAAVPTLAPAVRGKKVSYFPLTKSRDILSMAGAILQEVGITVDANLITAENEWMSRVWAEAFRDMLIGVPVKIPKLTPSGVTPKRIPRKPVHLIGQGKV